MRAVLRIAVRHQVFGGHEQLFDGRAEPAFQQHRPAAAAQRFEQREVLHVARAHLHDVGVVGHHLDITVAHHFGDDLQAGGLLGLLQKLEAVELHALEIVRRRARLVSATPQNFRAGRGHCFRRFHNLALGFDRAGARHYDEFVAADFEAVDPHLRALLFEFLTDELVGRRDTHGPLDPGGRLQGFETGGDVAAHADDANHDALLARDGMYFESEIRDPFANMIDLLLRGM